MAIAGVGPFEVANAVGLVSFAVVGALKGADADLDLFGIVVLGVAVWRFVGPVLDHPAVLLPDAVGLAAFAATGALVGGAVFWAVSRVASPPAPTASCVGAVLLLRLLALHYDWELPTP